MRRIRNERGVIRLLRMGKLRLKSWTFLVMSIIALSSLTFPGKANTYPYDLQFPAGLSQRSPLVIIGSVRFINRMKIADIPVGADCCREYPYEDVTVSVMKILSASDSPVIRKAIIVRIFIKEEDPAHFIKGENVLLFLNDDDIYAKKYGPSHWIVTGDSLGKFTQVSEKRFVRILGDEKRTYELKEIVNAVERNPYPVPPIMQLR